MDPRTLNQESGPGWRELIESLHEEIQAGREREAVLLRLLELDRQALLQFSTSSRPRPASARPLGELSPLHAKILALLEQHPAVLDRKGIEKAMGSSTPLAGVLDGLCRRGRLSRLGKGVYALPPGHHATSRPA